MQNKIETDKRRNCDAASEAKDIRENSSMQILSGEDDTTDAGRSQDGLDGFNEVCHNVTALHLIVCTVFGFARQQ